ncbi:major capsid protein [Aurantimonas aggregata]|uniref:Major capsid protein n=1 Tax=Aurantimonas aggregata TaxID=2047720 RepID=A0A6L9MMD9_9HYPH|nr:major capsid protein [Aurantimonas aggregata]NDV88796.1 major capsid protein [Aurantimonas aggregata]
MNPILDIFGNAAFSSTSLTAAINIVPNDYGRINDLGLFVGEPITTTTVAVQFENGTLNLLPTRERGAPSSLGMPEKRSARQFSTFHIPHDDFVRADDVQNIIARTAADGVLESVQSLVNRKQITMRRKHAITLEHMRMSALRGEILDYDGSSLLNLFNEFGVTQKTVDFVLGTAATDVKAKAREVVTYIEDNLMGEVMSGVHVLASPEWYEKFIGHAKVEDIFKYYDGANNPLRQDVRRGFPFQGLTIEEYRGSATYLQEDGTYATRRFVPAGEAIAFPLGTTDMFRTYWAPADFIDTVNTMGDEIYVRTAIDPEFQRWVKIHSQSNPLPIVKRPKLLVKLTTSN